MFIPLAYLFMGAMTLLGAWHTATFSILTDVRWPALVHVVSPFGAMLSSLAVGFGIPRSDVMTSFDADLAVPVVLPLPDILDSLRNVSQAAGWEPVVYGPAMCSDLVVRPPSALVPVATVPPKPKPTPTPTLAQAFTSAAGSAPPRFEDVRPMASFVLPPDIVMWWCTVALALIVVVSIQALVSFATYKFLVTYVIKDRHARPPRPPRPVQQTVLCFTLPSRRPQLKPSLAAHAFVRAKWRIVESGAMFVDYTLSVAMYTEPAPVVTSFLDFLAAAPIKIGYTVKDTLDEDLALAALSKSVPLAAPVPSNDSHLGVANAADSGIPASDTSDVVNSATSAPPVDTTPAAPPVDMTPAIPPVESIVSAVTTRTEGAMMAAAGTNDAMLTAVGATASVSTMTGAEGLMSTASGIEGVASIPTAPVDTTPTAPAKVDLEPATSTLVNAEPSVSTTANTMLSVPANTVNVEPASSTVIDFVPTMVDFESVIPATTDIEHLAPAAGDIMISGSASAVDFPPLVPAVVEIEVVAPTAVDIEPASPTAIDIAPAAPATVDCEPVLSATIDIELSAAAGDIVPLETTSTADVESAAPVTIDIEPSVFATGGIAPLETATPSEPADIEPAAASKVDSTPSDPTTVVFDFASSEPGTPIDVVPATDTVDTAEVDPIPNDTASSAPIAVEFELAAVTMVDVADIAPTAPATVDFESTVPVTGDQQSQDDTAAPATVEAAVVGPSAAVASLSDSVATPQPHKTSCVIEVTLAIDTPVVGTPADYGSTPPDDVITHDALVDESHVVRVSVVDCPVIKLEAPIPTVDALVTNVPSAEDQLAEVAAILDATNAAVDDSPHQGVADVVDDANVTVSRSAVTVEKPADSGSSSGSASDTVTGAPGRRAVKSGNAGGSPPNTTTRNNKRGGKKFQDRKRKGRFMEAMHNAERFRWELPFAGSDLLYPWWKVLEELYFKYYIHAIIDHEERAEHREPFNMAKEMDNLVAKMERLTLGEVPPDQTAACQDQAVGSSNEPSLNDAQTAASELPTAPQSSTDPQSSTAQAESSTEAIPVAPEVPRIRPRLAAGALLSIRALIDPASQRSRRATPKASAETPVEASRSFTPSTSSATASGTSSGETEPSSRVLAEDADEHAWNDFYERYIATVQTTSSNDIFLSVGAGKMVAFSLQASCAHQDSSSTFKPHPDSSSSLSHSLSVSRVSVSPSALDMSPLTLSRYEQQLSSSSTFCTRNMVSLSQTQQASSPARTTTKDEDEKGEQDACPRTFSVQPVLGDVPIRVKSPKRRGGPQKTTGPSMTTLDTFLSS
ncbi:hypothetical protein AcV5_009629 [Taiwanofungus camphoratus]|nr:hypothetical protein AcV5_009629 [Antrodia cinnamomea]KAI0942931.1 hypothetical protein AcV7_002213 [Antrodia cinnamomea]